MGRVLGFVLGGAALLYVAYGMLMVQAHWALVYPFYDQSVLDLPDFVPEVLDTDEGPMTAYVHRGAEGAPVVLYFMGNVGALTAFAPMLEHHAEAGRSVLAMGYRGGGGLPGEPSEARLKADALVLYDAVDRLVPGHGPVVAHGYSLGTGIATYVAAERGLDGLVLSAPYARMCELMVPRSWLPACQMPGVQKWQSLRDAGRVTEPAMVLHGVEDDLIPFGHGQRMAEALRAELVPIPAGGHDDLMGKAPYLDSIDRFIDGLGR